MANNNNIPIQYNIDTFDFKSNYIKKLKTMSNNIDELLNINEFKEIAKQAIEEKNIEKVDIIYNKANELNKKYSGSLTNKTSFKTMKNRIVRKEKRTKRQNGNEIIKKYGKNNINSFGCYVHELFRGLHLEYIYMDLNEEIARIIKTAYKLNVELNSKEVRKMLIDLYNEVKKELNNISFYYGDPLDPDYVLTYEEEYEY